MILFSVPFEEIIIFSRSEFTLSKSGGKYNEAFQKATVPLSSVGIKTTPHAISEQNC